MSEPGTPLASVETTSRWPLTVGAIGIVVGAIMILDQVDDLLLPLFWGPDEWRRLVGPELADSLEQSFPARSWVLTCHIVKMALGGFLIAGSLALRRRRRLGVTLCRTWAGLATAWVAIETTWALRWLSDHVEEITGLSAEGWQGTATLGVLIAAALLLVWPAILLIWLARTDVRQEIAGWPP